LRPSRRETLRFAARNVELAAQVETVADLAMYTAKTKSISVTVEPRYLEDRSDPLESRFFWAYTIEIANDGPARVGTMVGTYEAVDDDGKIFSVEIPAFSLDIPGEERVLN
jgi:ApaG protein